MVRAAALWVTLSLLGVGCLGAVGCSERAHPPPFGTQIDTPREREDAGSGSVVVIDASLSDAAMTCGGKSIRALIDPPRIYFVLDRSGSMAEPIDDSGVTKYRAAWRAVGELLRAIGHRVEYGAALYPAEAESDCGGARQIFPVTLGDALGSVARDENGPILQNLMDRFTNYEPFGGTPTAAALRTLSPMLEALGERTFVVLATDGAPNCNEELECLSSACIPDLESNAFKGERCGVSFSCCDEAVIGPGAGGNCIDRDATVEAVRELADAGLPTYVIGMPGSEIFGSVLGRMAEAGGTARSGSTAYYAISDATALRDALFDIGTGIAIECDLTIEETPPNFDLVNVYFDGKVVPYDVEQGWGWTGETALSVRGEACATLHSGSVLEVQIVYGCQTVVR